MLHVLADPQGVGQVERTVQVDGQIDVRTHRLAQLFDGGDDVLVLATADGAVVAVHLPRIGHVEIELHRRESFRYDLPRRSHVGLGLIHGIEIAADARLLPATVVFRHRPVGAGMAVAVDPHPVPELAAQQLMHRNAQLFSLDVPQGDLHPGATPLHLP